MLSATVNRTDGRRCGAGFRTKRAAEHWANKIEVDKSTGAYIAPVLGRITVGELADRWLARKQRATAPSHYRTLECAYRCHVRAGVG